MSSPDTSLLRAALRGNAAFSAACAVTSIAAAARLAPALGLPEPALLTSLGVALLVFAALLLLLASRPVIRAGLALAVVAADALWVVATVPVLISGVLTPAGNVTAIALASVVGLFGVLQYQGVRRMRGADASTSHA